MSKDRLEEMEELLNEYHENIDDPFASTDNAMAIVDRVGYFVNRVQELEKIKDAKIALVNKSDEEKRYVEQERMIELERKNKRYRETIKKTLQAMGMVDRQKYGKSLERALEEPK